MKRFLQAIGLLMLAERIWKYSMVTRFFRRSAPSSTASPTLVSIIQPVLSGDPTMASCLERSLQLKSSYLLEYIWLTDRDDAAGQDICQNLMARYPNRPVQMISLPPPVEGQNPKTVKLIAGAKVARGEILCVLDDDTMLPDHGLELCLPYLAKPGVGLAFGLPYYVNYSNMWSSMVSAFVNSNSLLTYIPYTILTQPFTVNGMFYAIRRQVLTEVGGFEAIEHMFADDFAIAQLMRSHGYRLAQSPLCHGISTQVKGPRHYLSLIQRWFVLPRESLLRHVSRRERLITYALGLLPALYPLLLIITLLLRPSKAKLGYTLLYFGGNFAIFAYFNKRYLQKATPWRKAWWVPVMQIIFPLQLLVALFSPQRINWRGNIVQVERGGNFHYVSRRGKEQAASY
ncbi:glycosyltransferase [Ktedonosporobacter rubrisoli]|uniref:Glycosyltransferase n=1 Tax=Ktedonosporobacter rubrisoli TaxID=2509675 RepID=A0A4P6JRS4_KTERU|nr:glycosyltransferase [Ktedonosporobacter rubrisoli]QBD77910.1 glycosyltransferase [Ktedonosporobacter rubrisoli]